MTKQEIYEFMNGRDISASYSDPAHNSTIDFAEFVEVVDEADKVKDELSSKKAGTFTISSSVPAVLNDAGEVVTEEVPAVFYQYTTDSDLVASITSELDVAAILANL